MVPDMREDISSLREELTAAALHRGSLPLSLRDTLHPHLDKWHQDDAYFGEYPRSKEEENMVWMGVQEIHVSARECGELDTPESS